MNNCMDEVAIITSLATLMSMIVLARHSSIVWEFYFLVLFWHSWLIIIIWRMIHKVLLVLHIINVLSILVHLELPLDINSFKFNYFSLYVLYTILTHQFDAYSWCLSQLIIVLLQSFCLHFKRMDQFVDLTFLV